MENKIRVFREKAGMSQTELACRIRVASPFISDFELGKRLPWPKARRALAKALGVSVEELFPEGGNGNGQ